MIAPFEDIYSFAKSSFNRAKLAAKAIPFAAIRNEHYSRSKSASGGDIRASLIGSEPEFASLETEFGMAAWAVVLSVDLRSSSDRAVKVGAEHTYLTMHTYLPTMGELVSRAKGKIVGLRGDGLFAAFGITKLEGSGKEVTSEVSGDAVQCATRCGKAMLEATSDIINPILVSGSVEGGLQIGVGISVGDVVITRIGLRDANEVTAYGPPVNQACKLCGKTSGEIVLAISAKNIFPTSHGGRVKFRQNSHGFIPEYPADMRMLERRTITIRPPAHPR
jgi:class 3 adenylate cyclase